MARLILAAALLAMTTGQAFASADTDEDITAIAELAGVDPVDLAGAAATTGLEPREYLYAVAELARPVTVYGVWDRIAACESGGNWATNTGNGFFGGVQFDLPSWRAAGGVGRPDQASRATQIAVAERWLALTGWRSWPACSRRLGLR